MARQALPHLAQEKDGKSKEHDRMGHAHGETSAGEAKQGNRNIQPEIETIDELACPGKEEGACKRAYEIEAAPFRVAEVESRTDGWPKQADEEGLPSA